ncbi:MAG: TRAP transporter substrate-binding protein, partial [Lautropia sp.]
ALGTALSAGIATTPAFAQSKYSLASAVPNTGVNKVVVDTFIAELKKSEPDITIDTFLDGKLGGEKELLEMLKLGETQFQMGVIHSALYYPELDATLVPYLFPDYASIQRFLAGPIGEKMNRTLLQKGSAVFLGTYYQGPRWSTSNKKFQTLDELKGIKVRMPEIPMWIKIWGGMGATITPIPSPEVYSALKTGVIDAQENMLSNILGRKIYEAQKFLINTAHQQSYVTVMAQKDFWAKLPEQKQKAIRAAMEIATNAGTEATLTTNVEIVEKLKASGLELVQPKPEFRTKAMPIIEAAAKSTLAPGVYEAAVAAGKAQ